MTAIREHIGEPQRPASAGFDGATARRWECVCGQIYRVSGLDRHRIYWPIDAPANEPVLDGCCVRCRRPLPGKHAHCAEAG
jgi:hypothetical protein